MPRITDAHRAENRALIVSAAGRCFARDGFHQTSMPDVAVEAGVSVGAPYRYFASKDEIILEIAGDAFRGHLRSRRETRRCCRCHGGGPDLRGGRSDQRPGHRRRHRSHPCRWTNSCAVQAWGELLTHEGLRERAVAGFEQVRLGIAEALRHGRTPGPCPPGSTPTGAPG